MNLIYFQGIAFGTRIGRIFAEDGRDAAIHEMVSRRVIGNGQRCWLSAIASIQYNNGHTARKSQPEARHEVRRATYVPWNVYGVRGHDFVGVCRAIAALRWAHIRGESTCRNGCLVEDSTPRLRFNGHGYECAFGWLDPTRFRRWSWHRFVLWVLFEVLCAAGRWTLFGTFQSALQCCNEIYQPRANADGCAYASTTCKIAQLHGRIVGLLARTAGAIWRPKTSCTNTWNAVSGHANAYILTGGIYVRLPGKYTYISRNTIGYILK